MGAPVSNANISKIVGYAIQRASNTNFSQFLPQRIAILAEMNTANQATPLTPTQITSAQQAAQLYGWGSPMHIACRILLPVNGGGVNGVPVWAYPQLAAVSSTANVQTVTVTGTPTSNVTHTVMIGGRGLLETGNYDITVTTTDTPTTIAAKIVAAITSVLGCPVGATSSAAVATLTALWTGLTSQDITVTINTNGKPAGVTYAVAQTAAGAGTPSIASALTSFGGVWNTFVLNGYGLVASVLTAIQVFNGNVNAQTGQYSGLIVRPAVYVAGSLVDTTASSTDTAITDAEAAEMSNAVAPAPLSQGLAIEAAANALVNLVNIAQNNPNIDAQGIPYPDMPLPLAGVTPQTAQYLVRNAVLAKGCSTAAIINNQYAPQDLVTTYHPQGETPPTFRYISDLIKDWNVKYRFYLMQAAVIENKQIAADNDIVNATNVVKPKNVVAALVKLINDCVSDGLLTDAKDAIASISVAINTTNRNRFDISFQYERSGVVRIVSTIATAS